MKINNYTLFPETNLAGDPGAEATYTTLDGVDVTVDRYIISEEENNYFNINSLNRIQ